MSTQSKLHRLTNNTTGDVTEVAPASGWTAGPQGQDVPQGGSGGVGDALRGAPLQAALAAHAASVPTMPSLRWLRVDLEPLDRPGFYVKIRVSLSDVMVKAINFERPETLLALRLFGDHNLVHEDDQEELIDPFNVGDGGEPLVLSPAHRAGDPLPPATTLAFFREVPQDIVRYAFGQAMLCIVRGGRTEPEKKS